MRCFLIPTRLETKLKDLTIPNFFQRHVEPSYIVGGCYKLFNHFEKTTCHNLLVLEICTVYDPTVLLPGETLEYMYQEA